MPYSLRGAAGWTALNPELVAEIDAPHVLVVDDLRGSAVGQHHAVMNDVGAADQIERLAHIVIGDQHADATLREMANQRANVVDRDRIDAGEGLVEQHEGWAG